MERQKTRRKRRRIRYEGFIQEFLRNGYKLHSGGWPFVMLEKAGEEEIFVFTRRKTDKVRRNPAAGFTKKQRKMIEIFKKKKLRLLLV